MKPNDETNNANEHNMVKNPNWWEADQLTVNMYDRGVELRSTKKQLQVIPYPQSNTVILPPISQTLWYF